MCLHIIMEISGISYFMMYHRSVFNYEYLLMRVFPICAYIVIRYGVDNHNYWIRNLTDTQLLNHTIKTSPTVIAMGLYIMKS